MVTPTDRATPVLFIGGPADGKITVLDGHPAEIRLPQFTAPTDPNGAQRADLFTEARYHRHDVLGRPCYIFEHMPPEQAAALLFLSYEPTDRPQN